MGNKYWLNEKPDEIQTSRNILRWFKKAGKFQVAGLFKDPDTQELRQGKTAVMDAEDLAITPNSLDLLQEFIDDCRKLVVHD